MLKNILILNPRGKTAKEIISVNTKASKDIIDIENTRQQITSYLEEFKKQAIAQANAKIPPVKKIKLVDRFVDNLKFMDEYGALSYVSHVLILTLIYLDILKIHRDNVDNNGAITKSGAITRQALADLDAEVKRLQANASNKDAELTTLKQELTKLQANASAKTMELERLRGNASAKSAELQKQINQTAVMKASLEEASRSLNEEIEKIKAENEKLNRFKTAYEKLTALVPASLDLRAF